MYFKVMVSVGDRCRKRQFFGCEKDIFTKFPQICPKNFHATNFLPTKFL